MTGAFGRPDWRLERRMLRRWSHFFIGLDMMRRDRWVVRIAVAVGVASLVLLAVAPRLQAQAQSPDMVGLVPTAWFTMSGVVSLVVSIGTLLVYGSKYKTLTDVMGGAVGELIKDQKAATLDRADIKRDMVPRTELNQRFGAIEVKIDNLALLVARIPAVRMQLEKEG